MLPPPLDSEEKAMLDSMLRVDHAGEYGANRIYAGQMAVFGRSQTGPLIQVNIRGESEGAARFINTFELITAHLIFTQKTDQKTDLSHVRYCVINANVSC